MEYRICIVGVGFVGLTLSIFVAERGFRVIGIDKSIETVNLLRNGISTVLEPTLDEKLESLLVNESLHFIQSEEIEQNAKFLLSCNVFIVTPGTPIIEGCIDLTMLKECIAQISPFLKDNDLLIIRSTVLVGTCDEIIRPMLDITGKNIKLAMCPERTVEGSAMEELSTLPQIVGANCSDCREAATIFFKKLGNQVVVLNSLKSAELAKLVNNTYRDMNFGFANEIAMLCAKLNLSAAEIINAANYNYSRSNIALPGPSGGPCLEKDPWILVQSGKKFNLEMQISKSARQINEKSVDFFLDYYLSNTDSSSVKKILIVGLAFKGNPVTADVRGSLAGKAVEILRNRFPKALINGYEQVEVNPNTFPQISNITSKYKGIFNGIDLVLIMNRYKDPSPLLKEISSSGVSEKVLILDFWGQFSALKDNPQFLYRSWT